MDDHSFDKFIKGKLDGYEDPAFDPAAMDRFEEKLAAYHTPQWYEGHLAYYGAAASLLLFTVVNAYLFWPRADHDHFTTDVHSNPPFAMDSMLTVIEKLQQQSGISSRAFDSLTDQNLRLQRKLESKQPKSAASQAVGSTMSLGPVSALPPDLYSALKMKGLVSDRNGEVYLIVPQTESSPDFEKFVYQETVPGDHYPWPDGTVHTPDLTRKSFEPVRASSERKNHISPKMRNALQKHYSHGIGIDLAPHVDVVKGMFSSGHGELTPRVGFVADWVLSPSLSVETGLDYSATSVRLDGNLQDYNLPSPDPSLGVVEDVQIRNTLVSMPLAIKYRRWISEKGQIFFRTGYTPYFSINQEYRFGYDFDRGIYPGPDHHRVTSVKETANNGFYGGTGTLSAGITRQIKNKSKLEASVFYEKSFAGVGQEKLGLQLFGLRAAYWFNIR